MAIPHFFFNERIDGAVGGRLELTVPKDVRDHLHTARIKTGERFILVDAPGHGWEMELLQTPDRRGNSLSVSLFGEIIGERSTDLTLIQAISATDRMDQTIRQVTELGISRIIPLESERSTVRLDERSRVTKSERWHRVARSACEQSGQLHMPHIDPPLSLGSVLEMTEQFDLMLLFWEEPGGCSVDEVFEHFRASRGIGTDRFDGAFKTALFIGPEGGFSQVEADEIIKAGAVAVSMGDTILRTETAAVVATALVLYRLGGLRSAKTSGGDADVR